ncbi:hypothetical protein [Flavilitoribacter nigricans]|uniref:PKD/Chitinase domain-containing protein n=1 Tax=Flavilitoribacter nigricans (strain ATCC 23147 / DSM 23189 / NBRC 102662 / NCIMB 1420 / SS-2) TaxID=1122177 RepID=A0A2D0NJE3_FLAN2|nr:hypothetical protein [Flavilitoribacter nigricans]PHN08625.1 hypothetical protein CRP01_01550 [Flavilitoribacter nigricans DSM 23189 = NBRC 102662]
MKFNKYSSIILALVLLVFGACNEKEFYEIAIGPPSDLQLSFAIANDDSGLLTVYPEATGAAYFDIYYGDGTTEPDRVETGQPGTHLYTEGTYTVRAVAYSLSGESIETTQDVNIQFTPPVNLNVDVALDPVNTNTVTVTPTADNATLFEVYFGDVADEEPTSVMPGASAVHTYAESGTYTLRVVARSASQTSLEYTEELEIVKPAVQLALPIDFENPDVSYVFVNFGGATATVVDNPDASGENTSSRVGQLVKDAGAEIWAGSLLQLPNPIDFASGDQFTVKVWSPKSGAVVKLKVENDQDPNIAYEVDGVTQTSNQWETISFDFSGIDKSQSYHKVVIFMDFGNEGDGSTYYFDEFVLIGETTAFALPIDFEAENVDYTFVDFGNAYAGRVDNPDPSGINTSAKVGSMNKTAGAEIWAGSFMELGAPIDFAANDQLALKVWSPKSGIVVKMKVENSADPNINFEVDVTNTQANAWEELVYDFSAIDKNQSYDRVVVFFDFGNTGDGTEYYFDDIRQYVTGGGNDVLELPLTFESTALDYSFVAFGNVSAEVQDNPDQSGINTSARVAKLTKANGAEVWGGAFLELPEPIDFSTMDQIEIKTWSPKSGINVLLKLENATNGDIFHEVQVTNSVADAWETLTFDMSAIDKSQAYHKVVIFFDFGVNGDGSEYYYDDVQLK